jgi:hypothetical protein
MQESRIIQIKFILTWHSTRECTLHISQLSSLPIMEEYIFPSNSLAATVDIRLRIQAILTGILWSSILWGESRVRRSINCGSIGAPSWGGGGGKSSRYVGLTTLPPSCADWLEILWASASWSPKGLYRDSFYRSTSWWGYSCIPKFYGI